MAGWASFQTAPGPARARGWTQACRAHLGPPHPWRLSITLPCDKNKVHPQGSRKGSLSTPGTGLRPVGFRFCPPAPSLHQQRPRIAPAAAREALDLLTELDLTAQPLEQLPSDGSPEALRWVPSGQGTARPPFAWDSQPRSPTSLPQPTPHLPCQQHTVSPQQ